MTLKRMIGIITLYFKKEVYFDEFWKSFNEKYQTEGLAVQMDNGEQSHESK